MSYLDDYQYSLTEEQRLILKSARDLAKKEVEPLAMKIDADHYFPKELIPKLGANGFMGINAPEDFGGSALDTVSYCIIVEEISAVCASTSVIMSAHNTLGVMPIANFGTPEQKKKYLPKLSSGEWIGCFALSEPGTGSDAARQTCSSKKDGKNWIINGVKNWITNAPVAEVGIIFTMEKPELGHKGINCFIVDLKNTAGVSIGKKEDKLGICGSPTASIILDNVQVSEDQLLGKPGDGFKIAMKTLDSGRCGIAAQALGIARGAFSRALSYTKERKTFGKLISEHQSIQNYLAEMSTSIDAARLLTLESARRKDAGLPYTRQAAQAKLFASDIAMDVTRKAIQIHGGYGYVKEFVVERFYRDAKITEIYEGTTEIQKLVIAGQLLK